MTTVKFWKETAERAIKAGATTILAIIVVGDGILNAFSLDWGQIAGVGLGGMLFSVLTSIASTVVGDPNSPSLVNTRETPRIERRGTGDE